MQKVVNILAVIIVVAITVLLTGSTVLIESASTYDMLLATEGGGAPLEKGESCVESTTITVHSPGKIQGHGPGPFYKYGWVEISEKKCFEDYYEIRETLYVSSKDKDR